MKGRNKIKVSPKVKPLHIFDRVPFEISLSERYYFSFGSNEVFPCEVIEVLDTNEDPKAILIELYLGPDKSRHYVKMDEIGRTPEEAVRNTITL
ncbi:hypothetical protein LV84_02278 [Algoriphagus ratkowskyi]|uniref:Uncharacterized protein n=1 Tax=Algoriphagus ratkowskyi TaxID=57028 RepID=A0A2W7R9U8_9BACT|nr:hypothetical protein [Algoriphagus ratkowskyi]PZX55916.1 hypothetical protein LV84_02278 [Algoriphagus ratkowskyi]TXD77264.1 hypothetical protein ESW18_13305 [Algoriphagus ratkowskyi]